MWMSRSLVLIRSRSVWELLVLLGPPSMVACIGIVATFAFHVCGRHDCGCCLQIGERDSTIVPAKSFGGAAESLTARV